jgi:hypothetical protein
MTLVNTSMTLEPPRRTAETKTFKVATMFETSKLKVTSNMKANMLIVSDDDVDEESHVATPCCRRTTRNFNKPTLPSSADGR